MKASQQPEAQRNEGKSGRVQLSECVYLKNRKRLENLWPVTTFKWAQLHFHWCGLTVFQIGPFCTRCVEGERSVRCRIVSFVLLELPSICSKAECSFLQQWPWCWRESTRTMIMPQEYPSGRFYPTAAGPINRRQAIIFLVRATHTALWAVSGEPAPAYITNTKD